ncbi:hypothetical protein AMTR_s00011p00209170 [Amborella trichopoda]|uniref:Uncharacterized protein n=1 Tax=Amborella trichopoda TaxID=13333 RepID=W1NGT4_AMBTC|nr:hypothetical protein AMTR_s00011p00209170 [Amborella trichopoda]
MWKRVDTHPRACARKRQPSHGLAWRAFALVLHSGSTVDLCCARGAAWTGGPHSLASAGTWALYGSESHGPIEQRNCDCRCSSLQRVASAHAVMHMWSYMMTRGFTMIQVAQEGGTFTEFLHFLGRG